MDAVRAIYGIDFSGAQDAGSKIWIGKGIPDGGRLRVSKCYRAEDLPNSGKGIEECSAALVELISSNKDAVFGFDFPFGLPAPLVSEKSWEEFVLGFSFLWFATKAQAFFPFRSLLLTSRGFLRSAQLRP